VDTSDIEADIEAFLSDGVAAEPAPEPTPEQIPPVEEPPIRSDLSFDTMFPATEPEEVQPAPRDDATATEMAQMREQIELMSERLASRSSAAAPSVELTDEEREAYGGSLDIIQRGAAANVDQAQDANLSRFEALESRIEDLVGMLQSGVNDVQATSYDQQLKLQVPDIDDIARSREFHDFIAEPIPYSGGETVGSRLKQAHRSRNLPTVVAIMNEFRATKGGTQSSGIPHQEAMRKPSTSAAPAQATSVPEPAPRMLAWSKRQKAFKDYRGGRLTEEKFNRIDETYRLAHIKELVDYNA
jgi:hypothetical protein